jgi:uracil phosphoribosyltransferase
MLATGRSGSAANTMLEERGARNFTFVCSSASPEGVKTIQTAHPSVRIVTAAIDERLNDHGYIGRGLGDVGYRMFGSASSVAVGARVV